MLMTFISASFSWEEVYRVAERGLRAVKLWSSSINSILQSRSLLPTFQHQSDSNSLLHSLTAGVQLAIEQCQQEFQWDLWNCPDSIFSRKGRQLLTKETALVSAITAAGIIFSITRKCSRGQLAYCSCRNPVHSGTDHGNDSFILNCQENIEYAEKVATSFLEALEHDNQDINAAANYHNYIVGKQAVRDSVQTHCRCQGLSTNCHNRGCIMKVGSFQDISDNLRRSYDKAWKVNWNSVMTDPGMLISNQLVYLMDSPDYCQPNDTTGWPGTLGRTCSKAQGSNVSARERSSCRRICRSCGHTVRHRERTINYRCNCNFHWCCTVNCEDCNEVLLEHFCD